MYPLLEEAFSEEFADMYERVQKIIDRESLRDVDQLRVIESQERWENIKLLELNTSGYKAKADARRMMMQKPMPEKPETMERLPIDLKLKNPVLEELNIDQNVQVAKLHREVEVRDNFVKIFSQRIQRKIFVYKLL